MADSTNLVSETASEKEPQKFSRILRTENCSGQKPTFIFHLYIFLTFFLYNSVKKKWESGQKARKPLCRNGFSLPAFEIKVGKNPLFLGKTRFLAQILVSKKGHLKKCRKKWAEIDQIFQTVFPNLSKIGPKMAVFHDSEKLFFSRMNPFFTSVPAPPSVQG